MDLNELLKGIWDAPAIIIIRNMLGLALATWAAVQAIPVTWRQGKFLSKTTLLVIAGPIMSWLSYMTGVIAMPFQIAVDTVGWHAGFFDPIIRGLTVIGFGFVSSGLACYWNNRHVGPRVMEQPKGTPGE